MIEANMLNARPNAQINAYSKSALSEPSGLKYDMIPPINKGWDTLRVKNM